MNELLVMLYTDQATHSFGTTAELNYLVDSHKHKAGVISIENKDFDGDHKSDQVIVNLGFNNIDPSAIRSVVVVQSLNYHIHVSWNS